MTSIASRAVAASPTRPWPADRVEQWPIERLIPYANNPRLHSAADVERIAASILKCGWTNPVLVDPGIGGTAILIIASLVLFDTWFYWLHRLIHTRLFYRRVHRWHHLTIALTLPTRGLTGQ
jgi:sterol desaturase/sphingolipid hydroxylase (fatty acid hydroxylase superfamily)